MSAPICEAEWAFDVDFDVMCTREPNHPGKHAAVVAGNGGVWARIEWEDDHNPIDYDDPIDEYRHHPTEA